ETVLANLSQIVAILREDNSSVTILIAQLIPHTRGDHPSLKAFNEELTPWADSLTNSDSVIIVVDQASGFDPMVDTYDGVHPNESGDEKMAIVWFQALSDILP
ncbi:MAG: cellulose-binding protein, partial [Anaerolineae bacterium]|nr:cellulose-binding protein [Anaerolineae bacterium]